MHILQKINCVLFVGMHLLSSPCDCMENGTNSSKKHPSDIVQHAHSNVNSTQTEETPFTGIQELYQAKNRRGSLPTPTKNLKNLAFDDVPTLEDMDSFHFNGSLISSKPEYGRSFRHFITVPILTMLEKEKHENPSILEKEKK